MFIVADGATEEGDGGKRCAVFCAERLPRLAAHEFVSRISEGTPESSLARDAWAPIQHISELDSSEQGAHVHEEARAASCWGKSLTTAFQRCDALAAQEVEGGCGVMMCAIARSGVYVASVGLGRAVIGTEQEGGATVICDEVSNPHSLSNEIEAERIGGFQADQPPLSGATRLLGAEARKRMEPQILWHPDVVRQHHSGSRRYVVLASPGAWEAGPRLPLQWAVEAYRAGRSPADEIVARCRGDVVALVLVLPPGLGNETSGLPAHSELVRKSL